MSYHPLWRSVLFNVFYASYTGIACLLCLPLAALSSRMAAFCVHTWSFTALFCAKHLLGIHTRVIGEEYIQNTPVIYAVKHQSAWDIIVLLMLFKHPCFVQKRTLLFIPLVGIYMWRLRLISIDRKGGVKAMRHMMEQCKDRLMRGHPIVIFPEGSRQKPGEKGRYNPGVAMIYEQMKVAVVPVALASGHVWPRKFWLKAPGTAAIQFLPEIPAGLPARECLARIEESIETASHQLYEQVTKA